MSSDYVYIKAKDVYVLASALERALPRVRGRSWTIDYSAGNVMCVGLRSRKTKRVVKMSRQNSLKARGAVIEALCELRASGQVPAATLDGIAAGLSGSRSKEPVGVIEEIVYRRGRKSYRHRFKLNPPWLVSGAGGALSIHGEGAVWDAEKGIVDVETPKG